MCRPRDTYDYDHEIHRAETRRYTALSNPAKVLGALLLGLLGWVAWATFCGLSALIEYIVGSM